jgi:signal transduction histidine kinase
MRLIRGLRSIRTRLLATYLLLTVMPLGLLGWFMLRALDSFYLSRLQDDMRVEAGLIADAITDDVSGGRTIEAQALLNNPPPPLKSQARVFLFDASGRLIAASDSAFASAVGKAFAEPGLTVALTGRATSGIEVSPAAGASVAYVAQPITTEGRIIGVIHLAYSLAEIEEALRGLRNLILSAVLLIALFGSFVSLELTRAITGPLERLGAAAADIAGGNFARRVPEEAPAELTAFARNFNHMAEALQQAEQARQAAFANIAHDVRTPLGSIRAAAEALQAGAVEEPELRARLLGGLVEHAQYLGRLTDDLLRLATYEGGGLILRRNPVDVSALVAQALQGVEARAQTCAITLTPEVPAGLPPVWADADRVLEILFNLLDNALRYTPPGGEIRLAIEVDPARQVLRIHVCDTGPGIPTDVLPHLFERYWRGDYRRTGGWANMGLGLSIVREIVKAHGGVVAVANCPAGGADFQFSLPLAPA